MVGIYFCNFFIIYGVVGCKIRVNVNRYFFIKSLQIDFRNEYFALPVTR